MTREEYELTQDDLNHDRHQLYDLINALEKYSFFYDETLNAIIRKDIKRYKELKWDIEMKSIRLRNERFEMENKGE